METKTIEIRDSATFIPALAVRMGLDNTGDEYLLGRAGFKGLLTEYILLVHLESMRIQYDPFGWGDRTMNTAHQYIQAHYDELYPGAVVDVEFILGERSAPKLSERETGHRG